MVKTVNATDTSKLVTKTEYNAKIKDIEDKMPSNTTTLTAVESKIPNVSDLVKKLDYDNEINEIKCKYFDTLIKHTDKHTGYNKFTNNILDVKITAKNLVNEFGLIEKIKTLATKGEIKILAAKAELRSEQDKIVKL